MDKCELRKLKKKSKRTLRMERQELQIEQEKIRQTRYSLEKRSDKLIEALIAAVKDKNNEGVEVLENEIQVIKNEIKELEAKYKTNAEALELYSKVIKNDKEGTSSTIGSAVGAVTGLGALGLGALSLRKAYDSDMNGTLVNKKVLDVFNKINPMNFLNRKK